MASHSHTKPVSYPPPKGHRVSKSTLFFFFFSSFYLKKYLESVSLLLGISTRSAGLSFNSYANPFWQAAGHRPLRQVLRGRGVQLRRLRNATLQIRNQIRLWLRMAGLLPRSAGGHHPFGQYPISSITMCLILLH